MRQRERRLNEKVSELQRQRNTLEQDLDRAQSKLISHMSNKALFADEDESIKSKFRQLQSRIRAWTRAYSAQSFSESSKALDASQSNDVKAELLSFVNTDIPPILLSPYPEHQAFYYKVRFRIAFS